MRAKTNAALTVASVVAVVGFAVLVMAIYGFRPTPGVSMLVLGWMSLLATGYFLVRAVSSFDLRVGAPPEELNAARREELEREKRHLLKAIKEAEFDRDTGKMENAEADESIGRYRARAVEILRLLDDKRDRAIETRIEKELARRLAASHTDEATPRCPACHATNDVDAAFCKKCGVKLGGAA